MSRINSFAKEEEEFTIRMNAAIRRNKNFKHVKLLLNNPSRRQVCGIHTVKAYEYYNEEKRRMDWHFEVVGGNADFQPDVNEGGQETYWMLKDEWNMRFLASCYNQQLWDIDDPKVDQEVRDIRDNNYKSVVNPYNPANRAISTEIFDEIKDVQSELASCASDKVPELTGRLAELYKKAQKGIANVDGSPEKEVKKKAPKVKKEVTKEMQLKSAKAVLGRKNLTEKKRKEIKSKIAELEKEIATDDNVEEVIPESPINNAFQENQESELVTIEE